MQAKVLSRNYDGKEHIVQMPHPSSQRFPSHIPWHAGFCVARTDEQSMICYRNEQVRNTPFHGQQVVQAATFHEFVLTEDFAHFGSTGEAMSHAHSHAPVSIHVVSVGRLQKLQLEHFAKPQECFNVTFKFLYFKGSFAVFGL
uniref:DUF1264 domain-containing protein n=1 Tax=Ascaris lumbricoides TaxID=6252 RepID=A0A0M3I5P9_ASCLU